MEKSAAAKKLHVKGKHHPPLGHNHSELNKNCSNREVDGQPTTFCSPIHGLFGTTIDLGVDLTPVQDRIFEAKLTYHRELWKIICERGMEGDMGEQQGEGEGGEAGEGGGEGGDGGGEGEEAAEGDGEENKSNVELLDSASNTTRELGAGVVTVRRRHRLPSRRQSSRRRSASRENSTVRRDATAASNNADAKETTAPSHPRSEQPPSTYLSTTDTAVAMQQQQPQQQPTATEAPTISNKIHCRPRAELNAKSCRQRLMGDLVCIVGSSNSGSSSSSSSSDSVANTSSSSAHPCQDIKATAAPSSMECTTATTSKKFVPFYCGDWPVAGAADVAAASSGHRQHHKKRSMSRKTQTAKFQEEEEEGEETVNGAGKQRQNHSRNRHTRRSSSRANKEAKKEAKDADNREKREMECTQEK